MMRATIAALLALALAACQPVPPVEPGTSPGKPEVPTTAEACRAAGGTWGAQGLLGREQCVLALPDAGKTCRDADDCVGDCRLTGEAEIPAPGAPATGKCQATTSPFGCYTQVEDGKAVGMLCVD